ncbi:uncharacterized protein LOC118646050 [Monomorium pharaonis]|uniref:uncharacterized protein LOC118646050 n=1 Tax=Monomorium pharaonis TaxID=307658 RepID=UPI00174645A6|nr:uncharacterized protein LOC118646050 [Monomorium pharaonis]
MDYEIPCDLQTPYLQAIQKIPGDTASKKLSWIGKLISHRTNEDCEQLSPELLPILRVETAIKEKRHEDITVALMSEDSTITNRALKASWFFDGSHKNIINVAYFCECLFPKVCLNTRMRIVLALAHHGKDSVFAQEMFMAITNTYGVQTAYPLIVACDQSFAYKMIVEKELVLPVEIVKKIFRKNPDLVVQFFKLLKPVNVTERTPFAIGINKYKSFLPKLIKKRVEAFVELCEIHEAHLPTITLSNKCTEIFLKKAQQHFIKKPFIYIRMLPLKKINKKLMESIFPGLLPAKISSFNTNKMLDYLKYYPQDKRYDLLRKSYKNKYDADILNEIANVTPALLRLLPTEERIKQARIKIEKQNLEEISDDNSEIIYAEYEKAWICYLSVNEAIPAIKEKINKKSSESCRSNLFVRMMYVCKINEDDDALFDTLTYFLNRFKNENSWVFEQLFYYLLEIYNGNIPYLNEKLIFCILKIIRLYYVKTEYMSYPDILSAVIHFRLIHNMPIEELIDMFLDNNRNYISFNILQEYPQYERLCLVTFANQIEKKSFKDLPEKGINCCRLVVAMYDFNDRCKKSRIEIEKMTITDYPWLRNAVFQMLVDSEEWELDDCWNLKDVLKKNEPELYDNLYDSILEDNIANVTSGAALTLLKQDLENVLDNWEEYLEDCMENYRSKSVQRFVRATRWYKDLPVKFTKRCMNYMHDKDTDKLSSSVVILAILLHGDVLTKLINPLIPTEITVNTSHKKAKDNYKFIKNLSLSINLSNPPIPLDLVARLCKGDYLSIALMTLINISRRTSIPNVISVVQKLMNMRVSTRKHGIRLMYLIASVHELTDFLQKAWATENHHSIRQVLFNVLQKFFVTKPTSETWSLYYQTMSTFSLKDEGLLLDVKLFPEISNKYVTKYLDLWLKTIDNLREMGLSVQKTNKYIAKWLSTLTTPHIFHLLPDKFAENVLRRFLFYMDDGVSSAARDFTILYILSEDKDKHTARIKIFTDVFHKTVTTYWNVPDPTKLRSYPINKAVRLFMDELVFSYIDAFYFKKKFINLKVIDNMQIIFSSVLSPEQDAWSYLLLVYAKKLQECISTKESFGLKIGQQLQELIDIFSLQLVPFIAEVLIYFLRKVYKDFDLEEVMLDVMEGLIKADNTNSCFIAVKMLPSTIKTKHIARYDRLIEKFQEMNEKSIITTVLYNYLNKTDLTTTN